MTGVSRGYTLLTMSLSNRLRVARERSGLTQDQVAEHIGITSQAVTQWESGKTAPARQNLPKVADLYGVPVGWLLSGGGEPWSEDAASRIISAEEAGHAEEPGAPREPPSIDAVRVLHVPALSTMPKNVPVLGVAVGGDDADFQFNGDTVDHVRRPPGLEGVPGAFAVYVMGFSMSPRYDEGDLVYVHPGRPPRPGDDVIVEMHSVDHHPGYCYIKRLVRRTASKVICRQFNPARDDLEYDAAIVKKIHKIMTQAELLGV